jgi:hypothetical protein
MNFKIGRRTRGVAALVALGLVSFVVTYALRDSDPRTSAEGNETSPADSVLPAPAQSPDTRAPYWYVPYENAERDAPKFEGEIAGIAIFATPQDASAFDVCASGFEAVPPDRVNTSQGPLAIPVETLPAALEPLGGPEALACDGELFDVTQMFEVKPGAAGVNPGGSGVSIQRSRAAASFVHAASRERWSETTVNGIAAVALRPIVEADGMIIGECMVAVRDSSTDVMTTVRASAANVAFCRGIAEAVTR